MTNFYLKYKEYKKKYIELEKYIENKLSNIEIIDSGVKREPDNNDKLLSIKKKLDKKGYVYWMSEDGKLLVREENEKIAKATMGKLIGKNKSEYDGKILIKVKYVIVDKNSPSYKDGTAGPIKMGIYVHQVKINGKNISLAPAKDFNSMIFYYFEDDLDEFYLKDMLKISLNLLKHKNKINPLIFYSFKQINTLLELE